MTADFPIKDFDNLLEETLGPDLKIEKIDWKPLTNPGDNYGSLIYSIDATVRKNEETEVLNLVAKLPPPTTFLTEIFNSPVSFWKELVFYRDIAPKFLQLQVEQSIPNDSIADLVPKYYGGRLGLQDAKVFDNQATIIMENVTPQGYKTRDRLKGLDLDHAQLAVKQLANFHALAIGLKIKMPKFFQDIVMPTLVHVTTYDKCREHWTGFVKKAHDTLRNSPEAKPYLDRIAKTLKYDYEVGYNTIKPSEPWGTIVHSDFWCNNMMFKYDDQNKPIAMKVIDYQVGIYGSGVMDLIFFLMSSIPQSVLEDHLDDLLSLYYKSFIDFLTLLKVDTDAFTLKEYYKEIKEWAPKKFGQCIIMAGAIYADKTEVIPLEHLVDASSVGEFGETATRNLLHTLKIFDERGWLAK